jgi:molecular chaperone GrpE
MSNKGTKNIPINEPDKEEIKVDTEINENPENSFPEQEDNTTSDKDETTEKLLNNIAELKDQLLRKTAELDNVIKRTAKEKLDLIDYANEKLILKILGIVDDFSNALEAGRKSSDYDSFLKGIELINNKITRLLEEEGVKPIESATGKPFDVNLHEAMMSMPSESEEGTVIQEMMKGYELRGKVIRHSKVITSSGEPA